QHDWDEWRLEMKANTGYLAPTASGITANNRRITI
ncbi:hypothetical protein M2360_005335, partial [Rhizobium sp. SG_E_25_P2]|nr:hypothetical protein [Rhizobium sp. SG_E_25_P2]